METTIETAPRIFLTDYASYNNGTQFEFGHWVNLNDFSDEAELMEYIKEHFKEADEKSPLSSPREEIMITDYEGFPEYFYSESGMNFQQLYDFLFLMETEANGWQNNGDNLLNLWNEYCSEYGNMDNYIYYWDDETLLMLAGSKPMDLFNAGLNADIRYSDDYLVLDGYGNIKSVGDPSYEIDETVLFEWIINNKI